MNLYRYSIVDSQGCEGEAVFDSQQEAVDHARQFGGLQVIEYEFEFSDSSLVWSAPGASADRRISDEDPIPGPLSDRTGS